MTSQTTLLPFLFQIWTVCVSVAQSCPTLSTPWTVAHQVPLSVGMIQARILEWVAISSSRGIFLTQRSNLDLPCYRQIFYHLNHQESPLFIIIIICFLLRAKERLLLLSILCKRMDLCPFVYAYILGIWNIECN